MTTDRDTDRIVRAWLDLMPNEAPDRTIDSVLQAVDATLQVRPRRGAAVWRFPSMTRFVPIVAAAALGIGLVGGALLIGGNRQQAPGPDPAPASPAVVASPQPTSKTPSQSAAVVEPSSSTTAAASAPPAAPATVAGLWIGGVPETASRTAPLTSAILDVTAPSSITLSRRDKPESIDRLFAVWGDGTLKLATLDGDDCPSGDTDYYKWNVSRGGTLLRLTAGGDACASRSDALSRTWYRLGCAAWSMPCIGNLEPGTYPSWNFATSLDSDNQWHPRLGSLSYTVPDGWTNSNDFAAGYWLEPTAWHDTLVQARGGQDSPHRADANGIYLLSRPVAALQDDACTSSLRDPSVGETADDLVDFLTHHPALVASAPQSISIRGLAGTFVDVELTPTWTKTCPGVAARVAALFTSKDGSPALGSNDAATVSGAVDRYIVLDLGGGRPVLIQISAPSRAEFQSLLPKAMQVVETFRFSP